MDTPYQWAKQVASHWGGTRNGTIVHWPCRIEAKSEIRNQITGWWSEGALISARDAGGGGDALDPLQRRDSVLSRV